MLHTPRHLDAIARLSSLQHRGEVGKERQGAMRDRFQAIANRKPWQDTVITSENLFPTPAHIASRMVEVAGLAYGDLILEPSCGTGRILEAIAPHVDALRLSVDACDISAQLVEHCRCRFPWLHARQSDFMEYATAAAYDCIIMNPPFRRGTDVRHIMRARTLLAKGGRIVALCYAGAIQSRNLKPHCDTWELLPPGSFAESGTQADVALITIRNP